MLEWLIQHTVELGGAGRGGVAPVVVFPAPARGASRPVAAGAGQAPDAAPGPLALAAAGLAGAGGRRRCAYPAARGEPSTGRPTAGRRRAGHRGDGRSRPEHRRRPGARREARNPARRIVAARRGRLGLGRGGRRRRPGADDAPCPTAPPAASGPARTGVAAGADRRGGRGAEDAAAARLVLAGAASPMVCALGAPRLLWPLGLEDRLSAEGRRAVLIHELAHLRRRDHWVGWLLLAAGCVWWWHPLFWWVRRRLTQEAELACDARVVDALPEVRKAYAEALLEVSKRPSAAPAPVLGASSGRRDLERRLVMVMRGKGPGRLSWGGLIAVGVLGLLALPAWSLGQGQAPKPPEPPKGPIYYEPVTTVRPVTTYQAVTTYQLRNADAAATPPAPEPQAARDQRLKELDEKVQQLLKEMQDLRGQAPPPVPPVPIAPTDFAAPASMAPPGLPVPDPPDAQRPYEVALSRVIYKLPAGHAEATASFSRSRRGIGAGNQGRWRQPDRHDHAGDAEGHSDADRAGRPVQARRGAAADPGRLGWTRPRVNFLAAVVAGRSRRRSAAGGGPAAARIPAGPFHDSAPGRRSREAVSNELASGGVYPRRLGENRRDEPGGSPSLTPSETSAASPPAHPRRRRAAHSRGRGGRGKCPRGNGARRRRAAGRGAARRSCRAVG